MPDLTFGEQVKIILSRKGMTIKQLAEVIEVRTGKKMSRQNLTQRLGRDNFQEQDMRMIASILECPFELNILGAAAAENIFRNPEKGPVAEAAGISEETSAVQETSEQESRPLEETGAVQEASPSEEAVRAEDSAAEETVSEETVAMQEASPAAEAARAEVSAAEETVSEETSAVQEASPSEEAVRAEESGKQKESAERSITGDVTVGEFLNMQKGLDEDSSDSLLKELLAEMDALERESQERGREREQRQEQRQEQAGHEKKSGWMSHLLFRRKNEVRIAEEDYLDDESEADIDEGKIIDEDDFDYEEFVGRSGAGEKTAEENTAEKGKEPAVSRQRQGIREVEEREDEEDLVSGDVNPYTGREYATNSVRVHPRRIGYVQVYDRREHRWTDMTEWAFLGYQERKKVLLGDDYEPPIYLD